MRLILLTLFRPRVAVGEFASRPRWLAAFVMLSVLSIVVSAFVYPQSVREMLTHLPSSATEADKQVLLQSLMGELPARLAFLPFRLFLGWGSFSLALLIVAKAFEPKEMVRFQQIFGLVVHTETISLFARVAALIDVTPPGLAGIIGGDRSFVVESLLRQLNVFTVWQIAVQIVVISILCGFGGVRSLVVVLLVWILFLSFNAGVARLLLDQFHFLI